MSPTADVTHRLAAWLNYLFATRLTPTGRPWTLGEVSRATGLSAPYIRLLRTGGLPSAPQPAHLAPLAAFFDIPADDLTRTVPPPIGALPLTAYPKSGGYGKVEGESWPSRRLPPPTTTSPWCNWRQFSSSIASCAMLTYFSDRL